MSGPPVTQSGGSAEAHGAAGGLLGTAPKHKQTNTWKKGRGRTTQLNRPVSEAAGGVDVYNWLGFISWTEGLTHKLNHQRN